MITEFCLRGLVRSWIVLAVTAGLAGCLPPTVTREHRRARALEEERARNLAEYESRNRHLGHDIIFLDSGRCLSASHLPAAWTLIEGPTGPLPGNYFSVARELHSLGVPPRGFLDSNHKDTTPLTQLIVEVGEQIDSDDSAWPIVKPLRLRRLLEEGGLTETRILARANGTALHLHERGADDWSVWGDDPRTQCQTGFGMVSLVHFAKCRVTLPEIAASAGFDVPTTMRDDLPTVMNAVRDLVGAMTTDCPAPRPDRKPLLKKE